MRGTDARTSSRPAAVQDFPASEWFNNHFPQVRRRTGFEGGRASRATSSVCSERANGPSSRASALPLLRTRWPAGLLLVACLAADSSYGATESRDPWSNLLAQADTRGLPTRFLRVIEPGFVTLEFSDLRTFAAEYHPEDHRMVLNRALSFNAAGGRLKPLATLTPRDLSTLYHELFHAYLDYLTSRPDAAAADADSARLLAFARDQQQCRYRIVTITPVLQRKSVTEPRLLTDRESWEALNETWAVFVGWAIWTRLELLRGQGGSTLPRPSATENWLSRLKKADRDGEFIGYYEPEDPAERAMTHKRYLAPAHRISPREVALLLEVVLGEPAEQARRSSVVMEPNRPPAPGGVPCQQ